MPQDAKPGSTWRSKYMFVLEVEMLRFVGFVGFLLMTFAIFSIFKPYLEPLPLKKIESFLKLPIIRSFNNFRSDVYDIVGDIRIHGKSSVILVQSSPAKHKDLITVKPYARKYDRIAIGNVRTLKVIKEANKHKMPNCSRIISVPAIIFSTGGYVGNYFHDIIDVLFPLYITSKNFNKSVIFLITNQNSVWTFKYNAVLSNLSKYNVSYIDNENQVLCFSRVVVGLKANTYFHPGKSPKYSTRDFARFMQSTYSVKREQLDSCQGLKCKTTYPRMLIISRKEKRRLINAGELAKMAKELGFEAVVEDLWSNLSTVAKFVNSFDVMIGVHGAGLTNMMFLPEKAVVVQIIPFGMRGISLYSFFSPAKDMNLRYLDYPISLNESSLRSISNKQGNHFSALSMHEQDVILDLSRFKKTLLTVLEFFRR